MLHSFKLDCPKELKLKLLNKVTCLNSFMENINKIIKEDFLLLERYFTSVDKINSNPIDEFKGDAFEVFTEFFINTFKFDNRLGIKEYRPWSIRDDGKDWGVDGVGYLNGTISKRITVQCKYRSNKTYFLQANEDHISNFVAYTMTSPIYKDSQMYIFTTAKGLNENTHKSMYHSLIRVFGFFEINKMIGNDNIAFWENFLAELVK
jgi:hypothetical protein